MLFIMLSLIFVKSTVQVVNVKVTKSNEGVVSDFSQIYFLFGVIFVYLSEVQCGVLICIYSD